MRKLFNGLITLLLMVLLGAGMRWLYLQWHPSSQPSSLPDSTALSPLWLTTLLDAKGQSYALKQFQGKAMILNFWATWCEPCREEMPEISTLASQLPEVVVLGVAVDEAPAVHAFSQTTPVSYPLLIAENEGMPLAEALGNNKGVLPYTVIVSAKGTITHTFFGRINQEMLKQALATHPQ